MIERRETPRWELKKNARIWMPDSQSLCYCVIEDVHSNGLCISSDERVFREQVVSMSIVMEGIGDFIKIDGWIHWAKMVGGRYFYGLSFGELAVDDRCRIYQQICLYCSNQYKRKWWPIASLKAMQRIRVSPHF
jgi:hypothetical protein